MPKIIKDDKFYYQYKSCYNISNDCVGELRKYKDNKVDDVNETIFLNENNERKFETLNEETTKINNNLNENDVYSIKTIVNRPNQCNNKFTKGPIFIQTANRLDRSGGEGDLSLSGDRSLKKSCSPSGYKSIMNSNISIIFIIFIQSLLHIYNNTRYQMVFIFLGGSFKFIL